MSFIVRILNKLARSTSWYKEVMFQDCEKFWRLNDFELDVVSLGSNSAKFGFDYSNENVKGCNWAMGPQSLQLDLNILQTYYSYLKPGATVIIPLCPFSCLVGYDYSYWSDKYYTILHHSQIPCFNIHKRILMNDIRQNPYRYIPLLQVLKEMVKKVKHHKALAIDSDMQMQNNADIFINSWKEQFFLKDFDKELSLLNKHSYKESQEILFKIVDFCKRYGFTPVIVMPPVSKHLRSRFSKVAMKRLVNDYVMDAVGKDVRFLNYFSSNDFESNVYFRNSYFLSESGAKDFTKKVLTDLNLI